MKKVLTRGFRNDIFNTVNTDLAVYGMGTNRKLSVYESIIESIKRDISLGIIAEGERLPSCRDMAMKLGINPNTVQRAYSELEAQGIIYTIPKKGVYAGNARVPILPREDDSKLRQTIEQLKNSGITREKLIDIIDEVYKDD